jgi:hypothetical protein
MFFSLIVLSWYCPSCEEKGMKNLRTDREAEKRCSEFMQKMEGRIKTLEIKMAKQLKGVVMPISQMSRPEKARKITAEEKKFSVFTALRQEYTVL